MGETLCPCCLSLRHDGLMSQDWARLARAIHQARLSRRMPGGLPMTQLQLAEEAGVSESTIQNLENPERVPNRRPPTLPKVESVFWKAGSVDSILSGGDPVPLADEMPAEDPALLPAGLPPKASDRLPLRVQHELTGDVVDTDVIDLGRGGMKMVVVITREPGQELPDDNQLLEDFREWSRVQRALRGIVSPGQSDDVTGT